MKRVASSFVLLSTILGDPRGFAQSPPSLLTVGEPTGDRGDLSPRLATEPLRLSLTSTIFPMGGAFDPCTTRGEASGNAVGGTPIERFRSWRLAPQLVLSGFSAAGCPVDGGMGGGVSYVAPLRRSLWLVTSAGFYGVPSRDVTLPARTSADLRIDLMKQTDTGRTLRVGIEQKMATGVPGAPVMITFGMSGF